VRPAGEDVSAGEVVVRAGTVLGPAQIALLASVGASTVSVHRRPRVAILTTGNELVMLDRFDKVLAGNRIVSSNSYGLTAAIRALGGDPVDGGIVRDDRQALRDALERAATCDLIITTAGVSVGDADYVKETITALGGSVDFWRVRMRPGSPLAFGFVGGTPWLGLPGNPVSALVTFDILVRPVLRRMLGRSRVYPVVERAEAGEDIRSPAGLVRFLRVRLANEPNGIRRAYLTGPQGSGILTSVAAADALLIVPHDIETIARGTPVRVVPLRPTDAARMEAGF
jgi:molybdopterin molybdotransferase